MTGMRNWFGLSLLGLGRKPSSRAETAFDRIMMQSRTPALYADFGVPDTADGRLEMVMLHMFAVLDRLQGEIALAAPGEPMRPDQAKQNTSDEFARDLVETMFSRLDDAMREMGIGDQSVPKKMKLVASAFYGRLRAYSQARHDRAVLAAALRRNVADGEVSAALDSDRLAAYLQGQLACLAGQSREQIMAGDLIFSSDEILLSTALAAAPLSDGGER